MTYLTLAGVALFAAFTLALSRRRLCDLCLGMAILLMREDPARKATWQEVQP